MTTKKTAAKKTAAKKTSTKKTSAKTSTAKKTTAEKSASRRSTQAAVATKKAAQKQSPASRGTTAKKASSGTKTTGKKAPAKKTAAKPTAAKHAAKKGKVEDNYTKPELREKIKDEVMAGDKGGRPGQWSARKAQMVAHEYVAEGGGYKHARSENQEHLKQWGDEKWHTADGKPAIQGETTHRYLPDKAWEELSPEEKKATDEKKVRGSRKGKQFVANTKEANQARRHAEHES